ncbi:MAG: signal transduction histidine kinase, nitrate/nitrite-specific, NarQ [Proteobacteria bacterium]|nr:signal transduction histidine kinase, nitrate/nitrite-specific, NarQ [Pseudomonadota bacterium]
MTAKKQWSLGTKLALLGAPFMLLVLLSTAATLWVSWQLDGGAAAVNEAGRMRMQAYRMSLSVSQAPAQLASQIEEFERSIALLRSGDPERPLFVPWDDTVRASFDVVARDWATYRARWLDGKPSQLTALSAETSAFVVAIDALVIGIESHMARWTALLYVLQMSVLALAVIAAAILIYTGYVFVLEPVGQLKQAIEKIQQGDFDARVEHASSDEFGTLAEGFNGMADNLQSMYHHLEHKVAEKTSELEDKRERLEGLYEVTALVAKSTTLDDLAQGFVKSVARIARADGVTLRWSDQDNQRYLMLAAQGMPQSLVDAEQCIDKGDCHCGAADAVPGLRVIAIQTEPDVVRLPCAKAGFKTVLNIPLRVHERSMGEVDLFFNARITPTPALHSLLEALGSHLASAMDNLRLNALEKEAAVAQERIYLARELHDSIAQSLAFIKIQVQLMRDAVASGSAVEIDQILEEIDTGVRESYGDVRELLLHFRTRTNAEDIEPALATTLRKFEHQSGVAVTLSMAGHGMPLSPDLQIQVLHIVQEALSNVRKHAQAAHVSLDVEQQPAWRFEVRDDGVGFDVDNDQLDETHVGLRIMKERAQRIGATLEIVSTPGHGSSIILTLPPNAQAMAAIAPEQEALK